MLCADVVSIIIDYANEFILVDWIDENLTIKTNDWSKINRYLNCNLFQQVIYFFQLTRLGRGHEIYR